MTWVKRWVVMMALGGMLLVGPTGYVVAPGNQGMWSHHRWWSSPPTVPMVTV